MREVVSGGAGKMARDLEVCKDLVVEASTWAKSVKVEAVANEITKTTVLTGSISMPRLLSNQVLAFLVS